MRSLARAALAAIRPRAGAALAAIRPRAGAALAAILALAISGCATVVNPVTGERELQGLSTSDEIRVGEQAAAQVAKEMGLVENRELEAYVRRLGERLAAYSPRTDLPFSFQVVKMKEVNAFALPGGHIYVSRGLLALVNSEDELAGVIGHEIGHVAARHHAQRQTRATGVGLATVLGTLAAAVLGGAEAAQTVGEIGQVAGAGLIASYGRDQERQSDEVGQRIAAQAGYDPAAIGDFLESLGREERLRTGRSRRPSFLDSHPATPERVQATRQRARGLERAPARPLSPDDGAFIRRFEGLLVGDDPAEGIFRDRDFLHPDLDFFVRFPAGWQGVNQPSGVASIEPNRAGAVQLSIQSEGSDPRRAAEQFAAKTRLPMEAEGGFYVNGLAAFRAFAEPQPGTTVALTWIAHRGQIFRFEAIHPSGAQGVARTLREAVESFRPLRSRERSGIRERRLFVVSARPGETLPALGQRSGNAWNPEETAVANGLRVDARLEGGRFVKIARERAYRGR